jgi:alpha-L-arabinofuranosidase
MKCLNDSGLKKLMIFLESRVPGITEIIKVEGNKLSIDKSIKLYAFVEDIVTEADTTVVPDGTLNTQNPANPANPTQPPVQSGVQTAAEQKRRKEEHLQAIAQNKKDVELKARLNKLESDEEKNQRLINRMQQANINSVQTQPETSIERQKRIRLDKGMDKTFTTVANALRSSI